MRWGQPLSLELGRVPHLLPMLGGVTVPKESVDIFLPPLQPQEIQNKTRLAWAKAHGHGSSTSVYTAGSTPNSVCSETLYMVGSVCSTI